MVITGLTATSSEAQQANPVATRSEGMYYGENVNYPASVLLRIDDVPLCTASVFSVDKQNHAIWFLTARHCFADRDKKLEILRASNEAGTPDTLIFQGDITSSLQGDISNSPANDGTAYLQYIEDMEKVFYPDVILVRASILNFSSEAVKIYFDGDPVSYPAAYNDLRVQFPQAWQQSPWADEKGVNPVPGDGDGITRPIVNVIGYGEQTAPNGMNRAQDLGFSAARGQFRLTGAIPRTGVAEFTFSYLGYDNPDFYFALNKIRRGDSGSPVFYNAPDIKKPLQQFGVVIEADPARAVGVYIDQKLGGLLAPFRDSIWLSLGNTPSLSLGETQTGIQLKGTADAADDSAVTVCLTTVLPVPGGRSCDASVRLLDDVVLLCERADLISDSNPRHDWGCISKSTHTCGLCRKDQRQRNLPGCRIQCWCKDH